MHNNYVRCKSIKQTYLLTPWYSMVGSPSNFIIYPHNFDSPLNYNNFKKNLQFLVIHIEP